MEKAGIFGIGFSNTVLQDRRFNDEGTCQSYPLALTTGQLTWISVPQAL